MRHKFYQIQLDLELKNALPVLIAETTRLMIWLARLTISEFILGIVGSLSLLAFVAGGLMWMLSAGNPEWVTRGKQTIIGAVIGLVVVFTSYTIIYFVYKSLGITEPLSKSSWFTADWFTEKYKNNR